MIHEVNAYPNPATTVSTLEYEVTEAGDVVIELRNNKGKLLKTVKNEHHSAGKYTVTITLDSYQGDLFYIVLKDKNGISTTENIVRVR